MGCLKGEKAGIVEQERSIMAAIIVSVTYMCVSEAGKRAKKEKQSQRA